MGTDIMLQLRQAVLSLAAGAAAGLLYDIFAVLRTDSGLLGAVLLDGAFSLMAAAGLFALGYGPGEGELRLFMLLFMLAGMGVYFIVSGGRARRMMAKGCGMLARAAGFVLRPLKKLCIFLKKVCERIRECAMKLKKAGLITRIVVLAIVAYMALTLVGMRGQIVEARAERDRIAAQVKSLSAANAAVEYEIGHSTEQETIESIAREKLSLVLPGETVYYDISE